MEFVITSYLYFLTLSTLHKGRCRS